MKRLHLSRLINQWLAHRPWRLFAFCLPALVAGGMLLLVILAICSQRKVDLHQHYDRLAQYLLATRKFEEARVACLHGLSEENRSRERAQWLFYLALSLNELGQKQEASALLAAAAPLDHPGCVDAHLFVAKTLLNSTNLTTEALRTGTQSSTNFTAETLYSVERHLLNAIALEPQSLEANEMLGRFYINTHNPAKARTRLMKIYAAKPDTALLLAITWVMDKDSAAAILWSDRAIMAYEKNLIDSAPNYSPDDRLGLVQALSIKQMYAPTQEAVAPEPRKVSSTAPQDSPPFWLGVVRLLMFNGKFSPALQTLNQQMLVNSNTAYASAMGDVCDIWAENINPKQAGASAARLKLVQKGLANAPENLKLQLLLVLATHANDDSSAEAKALMDKLVAGATGDAAAWWHFVLWTDARIRGDMVTARKYLQTAYELAPKIPQIQNDMAMDLSTGNQEDVKRGLKIIQSLVDQYPFDAGLRDTRGEILAKLGRNEEAVADLEYAVPRLANSAESQQLLNKLYAALGRAPVAPPPNASVVLDQVNNLMSQNKFSAALDVLEPAMRDRPNAAYANTIANICCSWVETLPANQTAERLRLIQKGLGYAQEQPKLRSLLLQLSRANDDSGSAARKLLNQLVAGAAGNAAAEWHLFLGRDARQRGDWESGRQHLETAYQLAPQLTPARSELALILSTGNRLDLEQGLMLIQPVVDQFPDNPEFCLTRGRILAGLGQNKDAVADLELAVAKLPNPREARLLLAKVFDGLGKSKLAEEQRRLASTEDKP